MEHIGSCIEYPVAVTGIIYIRDIYSDLGGELALKHEISAVIADIGFSRSARRRGTGGIVALRTHNIAILQSKYRS